MKKIYYIIFFVAIVFTYYSCDDYTQNFPVPEATIVPEYTYSYVNDLAAPDTITFDNQTVIPENKGTVSYLWDFGDGNTSTDENPVHIFVNPGTFGVTLYAICDGDSTKYSENIKLKNALSGVTLFEEDFEDINVIPSGWKLINSDGRTPDDPDLAALADSSFIVYYSSYFGSNVAMGTSYYNPLGNADDWMILPKITLGANSVLSWDAMSLTSSGNYPDSYRVYVSTTTQDITGCEANGIVLSVNPEAVGDDVGGTGIANHQIDLSDFANKDVYIAFRLVTTDPPGGDRLAIDNIKVIEQ